MHRVNKDWLRRSKLKGAEHPIPIGEVVRALRLDRGLEQTAFAAALDISQGHFSKIERGQIKLSLDQWYSGLKAMAIGAPRELVDEEPWEGEQPLFVLALVSLEQVRLHLLPMQDGRIPIFTTSEAARFAMALFEYTCTGNVCVLPIWPDFVERIAAHGTRTVEVPTPFKIEHLDRPDHATRESREALDAATGLVHAWLQHTDDMLRWAETASDDELDEIEGEEPPDPQGKLLIVDHRERQLWPIS